MAQADRTASVRRRGLLQAAGLGALGTALGAPVHAQVPPSPQATEFPPPGMAPGSSAWLPLWPGAAPGSAGVTARLTVTQRAGQDAAISGVTQPGLACYPAERPDGPAVLLIPGGGYRHQAGGTGFAQWLARRGVSAFVLLHRLPEDGWGAGPEVCLQDAQRAMRVLRDQAARWRVDPQRIAVHGASAGGHVAGQLMARFDEPLAGVDDALEGRSARPDFAALSYPVVTMHGDLAHAGSRRRLLGPQPSAAQLARHAMEAHMRPDTPPTFLIHAADDASVPWENSLLLFSALRHLKVAAEIHIFEQGGHDFGLGSHLKGNARAWPELFWQWGVSQGWLAARAT